MIYLKKKTQLRLSAYAERRQAGDLQENEQTQATGEPELCHCMPLSSLHIVPDRTVKQEEELLVLAAPELNTRLRTHLRDLLPRAETLSVILLHVAQVEPPPIVPSSLLPPKRQYYHASDAFLDQLMVSIRRVVRKDDQILHQPGSGAALLLPNVDARGAYSILERVYHSLDLLQAETVIPPLTRETTILLGSGSYPEQGQTPEQLLCAAERVVHHLVLRPALMHGWSDASSSTGEKRLHIDDMAPAQTDCTSVAAPFMHLPGELSPRLKQLIPYHLAQKLRCAPVGREHHYLTVAMANPADGEAVHSLAECTGMDIFPVSCEERALNTLLEKQW